MYANTKSTGMDMPLFPPGYCLFACVFFFVLVGGGGGGLEQASKNIGGTMKKIKCAEFTPYSVSQVMTIYFFSLLQAFYSNTSTASFKLPFSEALAG